MTTPKDQATVPSVDSIVPRPVRVNKYDAAKEFADGFKFAVCRGYESPRFDCDLFMAGFHYGKSVQGAYFAEMNAALVSRGIKPIGIITCQSQK